MLGNRARGQRRPGSYQQGVPTLVKFFGRATARELASQGRLADLIIGNNVLAQVPDLNDFVAGIQTILKPQGVVTMEFPISFGSSSKTNMTRFTTNTSPISPLSLRRKSSLLME